MVEHEISKYFEFVGDALDPLLCCGSPPPEPRNVLWRRQFARNIAIREWEKRPIWLDFPLPKVNASVKKSPDEQQDLVAVSKLAKEISAALNLQIVTATHAFFSYREDYVGMPWLFSFLSSDTFLHTFFHELGHWTGGQGRLYRPRSTSGRRSPEYGKEEAVAELVALTLPLFWKKWETGNGRISGGFSQEIEAIGFGYINRELHNVPRGNRSLALKNVFVESKRATMFLLDRLPAFFDSGDQFFQTIDIGQKYGINLEKGFRKQAARSV